MDLVLVGAPGSGTRAVGLALAQGQDWELIDVDSLVSADSAQAVELLDQAGSEGTRRARLMVADVALADPRIRARLYRGRRVAWLDAPVARLVSRVRVGSRHPLPLGPDLATALAAHLSVMTPYYAAGRRIDADQSTATLVEAVRGLLVEPAPPGTLLVRADTAVGVIEIGVGIVARGIRDALADLRGHRAAVMTDARTWQRFGDEIGTVLTDARLPFVVVTIPSGERAKTIEAQTELLGELTRHRLSRWDPIVALGDDRVCDATTFTAGVYMRGVPLVTVPTTLLGQIDLGIGGKGSVNLDVGRNLLGVFHQPIGTVIDVGFLRDEDPRARRAAMAEALKYALLGDEAVFALLDRLADGRSGPGLADGDLLELVERCAMAKLRIVLSDQRDTSGARMTLNLGHTLSHALETATDYEMLHGEAVAYGLRAALSIGLEIGETPPRLVERAGRILDALGLGTRALEIDISNLVPLLTADKKRERGRLRWVLARGSGVTIRNDVPDAVVARSVYAAIRGYAPK